MAHAIESWRCRTCGNKSGGNSCQVCGQERDSDSGVFSVLHNHGNLNNGQVNNGQVYNINGPTQFNPELVTIPESTSATSTKPNRFKEFFSKLCYVLSAVFLIVAIAVSTLIGSFLLWVFYEAFLKTLG